MKNKKGLGKGLDALLSLNDVYGDEIKKIDINEIEPNLKQPRKIFDDEKIKELSVSIKKHGIIQPIIVKRENEIYKIIAGERRWRAAKFAGLKEVPVIIKDLADKEIMEVALIENIQREDLNPIEEAEAYENLIQNYEITHEELANIIGKSRASISNLIRLLSLSEDVKEALITSKITNGHARCIVVIEDYKEQNTILKSIIDNNMTVRETESYIKKYMQKDEIDNKIKKPQEKELIFLEVEEKLQNLLGTKVQIDNRKNNKGKITIEYYSQDELERLINLIGNDEFNKE